jgi:hypothetical protein
VLRGGRRARRQGRRDPLHEHPEPPPRENPTENPRDAKTAYSPEPKELFAVLKAGRRARLRGSRSSTTPTRINGSYFSDEDRVAAMFGDDPAYPDVTYVVVSDARERGEARAFRWSEASHEFVEVRSTVRDA